MKHFLRATLLLLACSTLSVAQKKLIHAGSLLDIETGNWQNNVTLVVEGQKITGIQNGFTKPGKNDEVIDLKTQFVLPGFIDLHVHMENEPGPKRYMDRFVLNEADLAFQSTVYAKRTLYAGFTTVRDLGGSGVNISLRNAINQGLVDGPRIFAAGKSIATTGGHADPTNGAKRGLLPDPGPVHGVINGPDEGRQAVRQRYKDGADMIKITATGGVLSVAKDGSNPQFNSEELRAIIETAKDYGMHVAAHAHGKEGMLRAVKAGVLTIEHGTMMDKEVMDAMIAHKTWYVPTISAGKYVAQQAKVAGFYPELVVPKALAIGPKIQQTFGEAYKAGVKIAFGTDAGVFLHGENAKEFAYMVEAGMPALNALQSATLAASEVLGMQEELGKLKVGYLADVIAVNKNPLTDIKTLENIVFVMKNGTVYKK